jgi:hypothetical protein
MPMPVITGSRYPRVTRLDSALLAWPSPQLAKGQVFVVAMSDAARSNGGRACELLPSKNLATRTCHRVQMSMAR